MKKLIFLGWIMCWYGFCLQPAYAKTADSLYQIDYPVPSQSQDDWEKAVPQALVQVLGKVSGNPDIAQSARIRNQLAQSASLVQSYSYANSTTPDGQSTLILHIAFDPGAVNRLLQQNGSVVNEKQRALTLILLAMTQGGGSTVLDNTGNNDLVNVIRNSTSQRGLPILFPAMDLEDMQIISVSDIQQLNTANALQMAKRYGAQNILEGQIISANNQWQGQWILIANGNQTPFTIDGSDSKTVMEKTIDKMTSLLLSPSAAKASNMQAVITMRISGVNGLDDYADVIKYLHDLSPVTQVEVVSVNSSDILVNIKANGGAAALTQAINLGSQLQPIQLVQPAIPVANNLGNMTENPAENTVPTDNVLNYRWTSKAGGVVMNPS